MTNIKIYYIYFPNEKLGEYIRNESNNENWPTAKKYLEINKEYFQQIKKWKETEENNKKIQELIANIQKWFRMEGLAILDSKNKQIRSYKIEDIRPLLKETSYEKFLRFYKSFLGSIKYPIGGFPIRKLRDIERDEERVKKELDALKKNLSGEISLEDQEKTRREIKWLEKQLANLWNQRCLHELGTYLAEWRQLNQGKSIEPHNSSNIWVRRKEGGKIIFQWKVPERKFNEINNYLFYFYGEWWEPEPTLWEVVDYETAQITASFSQFYNYYWHLLKSEVNGIIEHSPLIREEVCECPDFNSTPAFADFTSDYRLPLSLFRAKGNFVGSTERRNVEDPPTISTLKLEKITSNLDLSDTHKVLWDQGIGTCFFVLGSKYNSGQITSFDTFGNTRWENKSTGKDVIDWLESYGLLEPSMEEILRKHIKATIYWRDKHIWQGNYWLLHNQFYIKETINPAGNSINICGSGMVITKLTESITAKIGGNAFVSKFIEASIDLSLTDDKGQNNRQTERAILSDNKKVAEDHWQTRTVEISRTPEKKESSTSKAKRLWNTGSGFIDSNLYSVDHTKSEYTMDQFLHRNWFVEDNRPLKLRLEVDQKLINWYRNKKELIGKTGQDFYNGSIANLLNVPGYLQMRILTSNFPFNNWFRNKLEGGINLWEKDFKEIYQKKLSNPVAVASIGDIRHNAFEELVITDTLTIISGNDKISNAGGGLWVYKDSYAKTDKGADLLPWLMDAINNGQGKVISGGNHRGCIHQQDSSKWVFIHPQNWEVEFLIPSQYLSNERTYQGQGTVRIDYYFHFFSSRDSRTGQELFANKFIVKRESTGNTGTISVQVIGNHRLTNRIGGFDGIPPVSSIPGAGITPTITNPEPFDTNIEIPQSVVGEIIAPTEQTGIHIEVPLAPPAVEIPAEVPVVAEVPVEPPVTATAEPPVTGEPPKDNEDE